MRAAFDDILVVALDFMYGPNMTPGKKKHFKFFKSKGFLSYHDIASILDVNQDGPV